ncbi:MAG: class I SAM-dependent methyltransferase, partial [Chitinophagaceae bacterium]
MDTRTFDDFDEFAMDYRAIHTANVQLSGADSFYFAEMKVKMLKAFESATSLHVLDLGCGDGTTEVFMQQYFPSWLLKGIDVSAKSIESARNKALPSATFQWYDGTAIPAEENSMDIVFVAGVLHHVNYDLHLTILNEIKRVLKPGGRLYLFEHNPLNPVTKHLVN